MAAASVSRRGSRDRCPGEAVRSKGAQVELSGDSVPLEFDVVDVEKAVR